MESLEEVSKLIRGKRHALGISQKKLARYIHMSQSTVARLESDIDELNPSYETVLKIITTLDNLSEIDTRGKVLSKKAFEIMHRKIIYARPDDTVAQAIKMIRDYDFPQLPVLSREMNIIGAVSQKRLMSIATQSPEEMDRIRVKQIVDEDMPRVGKDADVARIKKILESWDTVLVVEKGKAIGIITIYDVLKQL